MFSIHRNEIDWGGRKLVLETGRIARQHRQAIHRLHEVRLQHRYRCTRLLVRALRLLFIERRRQARSRSPVSDIESAAL